MLYLALKIDLNHIYPKLDIHPLIQTNYLKTTFDNLLLAMYFQKYKEH